MNIWSKTRKVIGLCLLTVCLCLAQSAELKQAQEALNDMDPAVRIQGLQALATSGAEAELVLPLITELLDNDPDDEVKQMALLALSEVAKSSSSPDQIMTRVLPYLQSEETALSLAAAYTLEVFPSTPSSKESRAKRLELYKVNVASNDSDLIRKTTQCLEQSLDPAAVELLQGMLQNEKTRPGAAGALLKNKQQKAKEILISYCKEALQAEDAELASLGVDIADRLGTDVEQVLPELRKAAQRTDKTGLSAAVSVYNLDPQVENLEPLRQAMVSRDTELAALAVQFCSYLKKPHLPTMKEAFLHILQKSEDENLKQRVVYILQSNKPIDFDYLEPMLTLADAKESAVRMTLADSLTYFGSNVKPALPSLQKLLKDEEPEIRVTALLTLYNLTGELSLVKETVDDLAKDDELLVMLLNRVVLNNGSTLSKYLTQLAFNKTMKGSKKVAEVMANQSTEPSAEELQYYLENYDDLSEYARFSVILRTSNLHPARPFVTELLNKGLKDKGSARWSAIRIHYTLFSDMTVLEPILREAFGSESEEDLQNAVSIVLGDDVLTEKFQAELEAVALNQKLKYTRDSAFMALANNSSLWERAVNLALKLVRQGEAKLLGYVSEKFYGELAKELTPQDKASLGANLSKIAENSKSWQEREQEIQSVLYLMAFSKDWPSSAVEGVRTLVDKHYSKYLRENAQRALDNQEAP